MRLLTVQHHTLFLLPLYQYEHIRTIAPHPRQRHPLSQTLEHQQTTNTHPVLASFHGPLKWRAVHVMWPPYPGSLQSTMLCLAAAELKQRHRRIVLPLLTPIDAVLVPWSCTSTRSKRCKCICNVISKPTRKLAAENATVHARAAYSVRNKLHFHFFDAVFSESASPIAPAALPPSSSHTKEITNRFQMIASPRERNKTYQHHASLY